MPDLTGVRCRVGRQEVYSCAVFQQRFGMSQSVAHRCDLRFELAGMNTYPADERRISEVERGRSWNAILPLPPGKSLSPGDSIIFALASPDANREPCYVNGGDSVRVLLTDVTDLASNDPATGQALFRLSWAPLGQPGSHRPADEPATEMRLDRTASPR